jgi:hypothetical protein
MSGSAGPRSSWSSWHDDYDDPSSGLARRLSVVVHRVREALGSLPPGPVQLLSVCAGQGRDVVAALDGHPRAPDVSGHLVESDPDNVAVARRALAAAGHRRIDVLRADAALTDVYAGLPPADLLLLCGIFGNVSDEDVQRTVQHAPSLCSHEARVIWTRHRRAPDLTPQIRRWCVDAGLEELAFDSPGPDAYSVGTHRVAIEPAPLMPGIRLFSFVR